MKIEGYVSTYLLKYFQTGSFFFFSLSVFALHLDFILKKLSIKASLWNLLKDGDFLCVLDLRTSSDHISS